MPRRWRRACALMRRHHCELGEFILPYDAVRQADAPDDMILRFSDSTYDRAAGLAHWNRGVLYRRVVA